MIIKSLELVNFRNYDNVFINFSPKLNIIYGNNAQGKTNILEGIYVLCLTKSHRLYVDNNLIKNGCSTTKLNGKFEDKILDKDLKLLITEKGKILEKNNNKIKKINEYVSESNIIIFYPEDLNLIKGSPLERRRYLNIELSQLYSEYMINLNNYNKILKIRNDLLKKLKNNIQIDLNYFFIITDYLIDKSIIICQLRKKYFEEINKYCEKIYKKISGYDNFRLIYKPNIDIEQEDLKIYLIDYFRKIYNDEIKLGTTLIGPHKDDYYFELNGINLKEYGSQGQQRMAILTLKLSEIEIFKDLKKEKPILLLDDVFSELDDNKKNLLLKYIDDDIQVIITTTDLDNINNKILEKAKLFEIQNGKIINIREV